MRIIVEWFKVFLQVLIKSHKLHPFCHYNFLETSCICLSNEMSYDYDYECECDKQMWHILGAPFGYFQTENFALLQVSVLPHSYPFVCLLFSYLLKCQMASPAAPTSIVSFLHLLLPLLAMLNTP